jgi:hypothetical protein
MLGDIHCTMAHERALRFQSRGMLLKDVDIPLAKNKLRMLCARLAVRCGELVHRKIAPYGDILEVKLSAKQCYKVRFTNTTAEQQITIEASAEI